jgi:hypothetical protein
MIYHFLFLLFSVCFFFSCGEPNKKKEEPKVDEPAFCDCVNKDYHSEGDKKKCDKIEKELTLKLQSANQTEKGDILMKIQDCKVKGQYDND